MKLFPFLSILAVCFAISFTSCDSNADVKEAARESLGEVTPPALDPPPAAAPATPEPPQNAEGVWHYTCANGCAGGGGAAGPCGVCGGTLAHNAAYHNTSGAPTAPAITPPGTPGAPAPAVTAPPTPEPAQNAAGVWHYTCPAGCAGGGGSATPCGSCGATLAHNAGYH